MEEYSSLSSEGLIYACSSPREFILDDNLPPAEYRPYSDTILSGHRESLGDLGQIPVELFHMILPNLDLRTLVNFRLVNKQAMWLVESLLPYRSIVRHAFPALHGILAARMGRFITCQALFQKLCNPSCQMCGRFAIYLYILNLERVCFQCFALNEQYLPLTRTTARETCALRSVAFETLPRLRVIPGKYSILGIKVHDAHDIVDRSRAYRAGIALHRSKGKMARVAYKYKIAAREAAREKLRRDEAFGIPLRRAPLTLLNLCPDLDILHRFTAIVRIPWLRNPISQEVEWGAMCLACVMNPGGLDGPPGTDKDRYTVESFKEHLKEAGRIEDGRHQYVPKNI